MSQNSVMKQNFVTLLSIVAVAALCVALVAPAVQSNSHFWPGLQQAFDNLWAAIEDIQDRNSDADTEKAIMAQHYTAPKLIYWANESGAPDKIDVSMSPYTIAFITDSISISFEGLQRAGYEATVQVQNYGAYSSNVEFPDYVHWVGENTLKRITPIYPGASRIYVFKFYSAGPNKAGVAVVGEMVAEF